jgi:hypothetical protein
VLSEDNLQVEEIVEGPEKGKRQRGSENWEELRGGKKRKQKRIHKHDHSS